jgi:hypothetical protein
MFAENHNHQEAEGNFSESIFVLIDSSCILEFLLMIDCVQARACKT